MVSDVKQIGELFKRKREEKNLSLKEVESSTSIRSSYLEAIEEGRENQFLSKVYMYGFMRQYAHFLELDVDVLSQDYSLPFENREEMSDFSYGIGTIEMRKGTLKSTNKWMPNLMWAAGSFGVLILAWLLAKYLGVV